MAHEDRVHVRLEPGLARRLRVESALRREPMGVLAARAIALYLASEEHTCRASIDVSGHDVPRERPSRRPHNPQKSPKSSKRR
jgi:hypothetical protein